MTSSEWRIGNHNQAILLTGRRGVGKTTVCQAVVDLARLRGYRPGGVITPALYACPEPVLSSRRRIEGLVLSEIEGRSRRACPADWELTKVGFEAVDVGSGERWPLARTDPSTGSGHRRELDGPRVGPYSFDPAGLARALRVLRRAATLRQAQDTAAGCDLIIVDEVGPLELEQGEGFAPILELLPVEGPTHTLIVVRPAFVDQLLLHLRGTECTIFSVTEENRDELPLRIVEELWGDG